jgi:hypothetical protein
MVRVPRGKLAKPALATAVMMVTIRYSFISSRIDPEQTYCFCLVSSF